jgi:hypothetical protein
MEGISNMFSIAEGINTGVHVHALDRVGGVRGALVHMTCPLLSRLPVHLARLDMYATCKQAASDLARVGGRACACARAACSPP